MSSFTGLIPDILPKFVAFNLCFSNYDIRKINVSINRNYKDFFSRFFQYLWLDVGKTTLPV